MVERSSGLRFGLLCNGTVFQQWQADAIAELNRHGHKLTLLIVDDRPVHTPPFFSRILKRRWSKFLYTFLENRIFKPEAKKPVDMDQKLNGVKAIAVRVVQKGYSEYFNETDLTIIREQRLDFILRFGFNIIRGEILNAARFGVWSFHHDDEMIYRGGPAGFWEIFRGDPVSGAILQRLTEKLDGGIILYKGFLKTIMHSYKGNIQQLLTVSSLWPALVADDYSFKLLQGFDEGLLQETNATPTQASIFKVPGNCRMTLFLLLLIKNRLKFYYREYITPEIWNVGVLMKPLHEVAFSVQEIQEEDVQWLPPLNHTGYLADPSGFVADDGTHILVENFSFGTLKAGISEIIWDPHPKILPPSAGGINTLHHLSYPFVFECDKNIYCVPESHQSSKITLYRREMPSGRFVEERVLLDGIRAVDPTMFFHQGLWWLFFTSRQYSNTHFFLYHSGDLSGEFRPHRLNPVKTDIRSARPAGTPFLHDNLLYRPAQDCSVTYGGRIAINRVITLTPDHFAEETVRYIEPVKGSRYSSGLHTISGVGDVTLIDGKTYGMNRYFFQNQFLSKFKGKEPDHA
ncbi:MAG: glucosamine inositolphosphorylceramide transferase family protein [Bacteroidales bacterium]